MIASGCVRGLEILNRKIMQREMESAVAKEMYDSESFRERAAPPNCATPSGS
jgi:hypothetical protein